MDLVSGEGIHKIDNLAKRLRFAEDVFRVHDWNGDGVMDLAITNASPYAPVPGHV